MAPESEGLGDLSSGGVWGGGEYSNLLKKDIILN